jgi:uroporphyrinogen decarboxylase
MSARKRRKKMTKKERVVRLIRRQQVDYLPSNVFFASPDTKISLQRSLGLASIEALDAFLENHLPMTAIRDDIYRYRGNRDYLKKAEQTVHARVDWEKEVVYDRWGIGFDMKSDGTCIAHHPLGGASDTEILNYKVPDPDVPGNYSMAEEDLKRLSAEYLIFLSGYLGIFERAWMLMGYEELLVGMESNEKYVSVLLEKILENKLSIARKSIEMGFEVGHTGDDFGGQYSLMMSKDTWRRCLMPLYSKLWRVYKDAGLPVIHHSCGNVTEIMGDLVDLGVDVLEPVQRVMDFRKLKKDFGKHIVFWGGIPTQTVFPFGTPTDVRRETKEVIATLGENGGLIIGPDQEIMADVPINNIVAYVETVLEEREKVLHM